MPLPFGKLKYHPTGMALIAILQKYNIYTTTANSMKSVKECRQPLQQNFTLTINKQIFFHFTK
jgi:hypothetical protein